MSITKEKIKMWLINSMEFYTAIKMKPCQFLEIGYNWKFLSEATYGPKDEH